MRTRQLLAFAVVATAVSMPALAALVAILLTLGPQHGALQAVTIDRTFRLGSAASSSNQHEPSPPLKSEPRTHPQGGHPSPIQTQRR